MDRVRRFASGDVRWRPPQALISRSGTVHRCPGSGEWSGPAWRSPLFIDQVLPAYTDLVHWADTQDFWFYEPLAGERQMFSVWFAHAIGRRNYENPVLHDLYLLHDLLHAYTFIDAPGDTPSRWRARMRANEIMVSLETEVLVYARCPSLRAHSFPHPVWADRFLAAGGVRGTAADFGVPLNASERQLSTIAAIWPLETPSGWSGLWWARRRASLQPDPACLMEQAIAHYERQAAEEYAAWGRQWRQVERYRQDSLVR